jgi:glucose/mannose transport system substrate-binding protein
MVAVFDQMRTIRGFVDDNMSGRDWNLASAMVVRGEAAMQLMGDWAKGEFIAAGLTPGVKSCAPRLRARKVRSCSTPTSSRCSMWTRPMPKPSRRWLPVSLIRVSRKTFNLVKGSIPARTDVSPENFDACGQKSIADMAAAAEAGTLIGSMAHGHAQPSSIQGAMVDTVTQHFNSDMSSQEAVEALVQSVNAAR